MADPTNGKIAVSANAGIIDTLTALGRQILLIIGAVPVLLALLGAHDFAGLVAYFQSADGAKLLGAVGLIASMLYGLYKTHKRGSQLATAAQDPANKNVVPK